MKRFPMTVLLLGLLAGCGGGDDDHGHDHAQEPAPVPTDRIAVPAAVRQNLGIEFVRVERRRVAATLRVPGHFELLPAARREYRTPVAGRVELLVSPLQRVQQGEPLYRVDSPTWRQLQRELAALQTELVVTEARQRAMAPLALAHKGHEGSLGDAVRVLEARQERLRQTQTSVGGQAAELASIDLQLAQTKAQLAEAVEKRTGVETTIAELQANAAALRERFELQLQAAATIAGVDAAALRGDAGNGEAPPWRTLAVVTVRASADGIADALPTSTGGWVEPANLVLVTTDPQQVRFRARGLQSDLPRLQNGLPAAVVPPHGGLGAAARIDGELALGIEADPAQRTIDLFLLPRQVPDWARSGVAAFLEIETRSGGDAELAVPLGCVLQDGLQRVLFRRDPKDQDQVIRVVADLGVDDGRWVEVRSGLVEGDEVVRDGAYELVLASSGSVSKAGHFHADGTFHDGEHK